MDEVHKLWIKSSSYGCSPQAFHTLQELKDSLLHLPHGVLPLGYRAVTKEVGAGLMDLVRQQQEVVSSSKQ